MKTLKLMIFTYKQLPDTNCNLRKLLAQVDHNLKNYFHRREKPLSVVNARSRYIAIRLKSIHYS